MSISRELSLVAGLSALALARRRPFLALGLGVAALALRVLPRPYAFQGKVVVLAGGSRGLGFALAKQLRREGAHLLLLARDPVELDRASDRLKDIPGDGFVEARPCDVTKRAELERAIQNVAERLGRVDAFFHNAGAITVGPFASMRAEDFEAALRIHLHAAVAATQVLLPHFRRSGGGRIVFISSVGGKIPVPHLSAYCASKFALAGFSQSAGAELAKEDIHLTTVFPGLMRTGSAIQAVFTGDQESEFSWFAAAGTMPGLSMNANLAARKILESVSRGDREVVLSLPAKAGALLYDLLPETFLWMNRLIARLLPGSERRARRTGAAAQGKFARATWAAPFRRIAKTAEREFNQSPSGDAEAQLGLSPSTAGADRDSSSTREAGAQARVDEEDGGSVNVSASG